jgi:ATP-dependent 26S proteasome regulatory subunit
MPDIYFQRCLGSVIREGKKPGETLKTLVTMFDTAILNAPSLIFIDQFEMVGAGNGDLAGGAPPLLRETIKAQLDKVHNATGDKFVVVVCATSTPGVIDPALRRAGRLSHDIELGLPDEKSRLHCLRLITKRMRLDEDVDLELVAKRSNGSNGAALEGLCTEAALISAREVLRGQHESKRYKLEDSQVDKLLMSQRHWLEALDHTHRAGAEEEKARCVCVCVCVFNV